MKKIANVAISIILGLTLCGMNLAWAEVMIGDIDLCAAPTKIVTDNPICQCYSKYPKECKKYLPEFFSSAGACNKTPTCDNPYPCFDSAKPNPNCNTGPETQNPKYRACARNPYCFGANGQPNGTCSEKEMYFQYDTKSMIKYKACCASNKKICNTLARFRPLCDFFDGGYKTEANNIDKTGSACVAAS